MRRLTSDAPPLARRDDGVVDLVDGQGRAVHHQADVALLDQARDQQDHLPLGPAVGAAPEAGLDEILQHDLLAGAGHEVDVGLHLGEGLQVALAGLQREAEVVDVGGAQHRLDLGLGVGGEVGEVAELVEAVADEVVQGLGEDAGRRAALLLQGLADRVVARLLQELLQLQDQALAALAVLVLALAQDLERGVGGRAVVLAPDVLVGLQIGAKLAPERLVVVEPDDELAALQAALQDALGLVVGGIVVGERRDDRHHQVAVGVGCRAGAGRTGG